MTDEQPMLDGPPPVVASSWDGVSHQRDYLTAAERSTVLDEVIVAAVATGARLEARSPHRAVLVYGHKMSDTANIFHLLLTVFTCGLWVIVWLLVAMFSQEKRITVSVNEFGDVSGFPRHWR